MVNTSVLLEITCSSCSPDPAPSGTKEQILVLLNCEIDGGNKCQCRPTVKPFLFWGGLSHCFPSSATVVN